MQAAEASTLSAEDDDDYEEENGDGGNPHADILVGASDAARASNVTCLAHGAERTSGAVDAAVSAIANDAISWERTLFKLIFEWCPRDAPVVCLGEEGGESRVAVAIGSERAWDASPVSRDGGRGVEILLADGSAVAGHNPLSAD